MNITSHCADYDVCYILYYFVRLWPSMICCRLGPLFNTLRPRQNERHFADDSFKCILLNENAWITIKHSLKFVPKGLINNIPALVQIMAWRRPGDKPLSEPMLVSFPGGAPLQWSWLVGSAVLTPLFQGTGKKYRILTPFWGNIEFWPRVPREKNRILTPIFQWPIEYWPLFRTTHRILTPIFQWLIEYWPPFLWPHIDFWPLFFSSAATHRILTPLFWRP